MYIYIYVYIYIFILYYIVYVYMYIINTYIVYVRVSMQISKANHSTFSAFEAWADLWRGWICRISEER